MSKILIPTPLRKFTDAKSSIEVPGDNVNQAIAQLAGVYPALKPHLLENDGAIRGYINIFVGDDDIRDLDHGDTAVAENTVISIVPAIAGGNY